jgi:mono/diheme cytochrome c family protein
MLNPTLTRALALAFVLMPSQAEEPKATDSADPDAIRFSRNIAPILVRKCVACHGPEKSKGGYRLDTFELLMKGGESKSPSVTPGQPAESQLFRLITAEDADDRMPQKDEPLPSAQIEVIERWIRQGAQFDGPDPKAALATLIPRVPHPDAPAVYRRPVPIMALAFRPDGQELAAGGYNEITIWSPTNGSLLRRVRNVAQRTQDLAYNPDGSLLAAAGGVPGQLGELALFNTADGSVMRVLATMPDMALSVRFSPDGTRLAAGGADNSIRIYEVATGREQLVIQQHADWVMAVAWNPEGTQLASASRDRTARIYDTKTGELEATYTGHQGPVFAVAFAPDGKRACSAGRDKRIHLWEAADGKKSGEIEGAEDEILRLLVRENTVFGCSADNKVRQHSIDKKELIRTCSGHNDCVFALALDAKAQRLASGSHDGEVRVWSVEDGRLLTTFVAAPGFVPTEQTPSP